ncbi:MAG: FAD:protein FMN transferase [Paludibacteraceae bacterium]|nr:FAD:protein FMN transferase [Paludibacteraceae bacterium]
MDKRIYRTTFALLFLGAAAFFLWAYPDEEKVEYYHNQGKIFGTYYNIRYSATKDLEKGIVKTMQEFDNSLSAFNQESTISLINRNESTKTDAYFEQMYEKAEEVWQLSDGAFDITVAPLVNAWGFGFKNKAEVTGQMIDSLKQFVGMPLVKLDNHKLIKQDCRTMLDASAIAKGQACDVVADFLKEKGCEDLLVDIGGEVVLKGVNENGEPWRVGIVKPQDDPTGTHNTLQEVISSTSLSMATSGNYRQFYYENGIRRSHTIDPRSGYPVNHSLLSATVIADNCMTADALATACMVLGKDSAMLMINNIHDAECYLIYADGDSIDTAMSEGFHKLIRK